jgi:16S rRNA processing protein RimM
MTEYRNIGKFVATHGYKGDVVLLHHLGKKTSLKDGIDSKETAEKILKKEVWVNETDFSKYAHNSAPASLVNFHLINEGIDLGVITEVIELPHQLLCKIYFKEKEALIPLHDETLQKIDKKNKQVHVILPDGLLDIYQ